MAKLQAQAMTLRIKTNSEKTPDRSFCRPENIVKFR
jgi:hypothetical protein